MALPPSFEVARLFFISRALGFLLYRGIDRSAQGGWIQRSGRDGLVIDEDCRSIPNSERLASFSVGLNFGFDLLAADVFFESLQVQANQPGVGVKQRLDILGFGPDCLLAIKQIMHFPEASLETCRFGSIGSLMGMFVNGKGEIAEDDTQTRGVIALNLLEVRFQSAARRTLEVRVFFKRNRGISRAARVYFFATLLGSDHCFGNGRRLRTLRPIKHDARSESAEADHGHDEERKNAFQGCLCRRKV